MTAFIEIRLPECIEKGAQGGPGFNTSVFTLSSGFEKRNVNWSEARGQYDISYAIQTKENYSDVLEFFYARMGKAYGFRFKDWSDFEIAAKQGIGIGDGANDLFQIYKRYSSGSVDYDRVIRKIVAGTVTVWLDAAVQGAGFTLDYNTGLITFDTPPAADVVVSVKLEFDVPVRFDIDKLNINLQTIDLGSIPQIPLVELKL